MWDESPTGKHRAVGVPLAHLPRQLSISLSCLGILTWACYSTHLKYFVDFKAWTHTRVTGLTTTLSSGGASTASKHSSRRGESDAWQRASSEADQGAGNASRF